MEIDQTIIVVCLLTEDYSMFSIFKIENDEYNKVLFVNIS